MIALPTEIWTQIIGGICSKYVYCILMQPKAREDDDAYDHDSEVFQYNPEKCFKMSSNPLISLLLISYQIREVTIKVLHESFGSLHDCNDSNIIFGCMTRLLELREARLSLLRDEPGELVRFMDSHQPAGPKPSLTLLDAYFVLFEAERRFLDRYKSLPAKITADNDVIGTLSSDFVRPLYAAYDRIMPRTLNESFGRAMAETLSSFISVLVLQLHCKIVDRMITLIRQNQDNSVEEDYREDCEALVRGLHGPFDLDMPWRYFRMTKVLPCMVRLQEKLRRELSHDDYDYCFRLSNRIIDYWFQKFPWALPLDSDEEMDDD
ncbi:hypothetical protein ABKN59_011074 [Abortiporus biennis]